MLLALSVVALGYLFLYKKDPDSMYDHLPGTTWYGYVDRDSTVRYLPSRISEEDARLYRGLRRVSALKFNVKA